MVGMTAPGMRLGTLLATMLLAVSACSGGDSEPVTTAPTSTAPTTTTTTAPPPETTTTTSTTTTTTQAPTTTVDPLARPDVLVSNFDRESVDDFDTKGDNLWVVMLEIQDLYDYFEGNPEGSGEEMLGLLYTPDYRNFDVLADDLQELADNDWRYVDAGTRTLAIDVEDVSGDAAVVAWASERGEQLVADAEGTIVKTLEGWDLDLITYRLHRGDDGRWRIAEFVDRVHPVPTDVLDAMVPVQWKGRST